MNDAQRYRVNAAECISAAERYELPYRDRTLAIAESWLSLARQQEAMIDLLAILSSASADTLAESLPDRRPRARRSYSPLKELVHT
jgi:hypothetical protein